MCPVSLLPPINQDSLFTGAVTMPATCPDMHIFAASSTHRCDADPDPASCSPVGNSVPSQSLGEITSINPGSAFTSEGEATSITVSVELMSLSAFCAQRTDPIKTGLISVYIERFWSDLATTSGPMPEGSPIVTASRGLSVIYRDLDRRYG